MKNISKALFCALLLVCSTGAYAEDKYDQLARELTEAGAAIQGKKIAIIPFSYADGRTTASKDGSVIAERLTIKMINAHKFEIIERSVLDKVMNELKLQASGVIDASSAQQLGKVLGVEAIITGTIVETSAGQIEVNARLIKTETAQAIGASQVAVEKNWIGDASAAPQQPYAQPYQQPVQAAPARAPYVRGEYEYGFFDLFLGFGAPNMSLEFSNPTNKIALYDLGVALSNGANLTGLNSVKWDKLETEGVGPIAMRVGGFGKKAMGGALELSFEKRNAKAQNTTWSVNNGPTGTFTNFRSDYVTVKTFGISGDLLIRHAGKKVDPYIGIGLGMSLNAITLPYVKGYTNGSFVRPTEDFGVGFMFRVPIGMRIKAGNNTQIVTEFRYEMNRIGFDRGGRAGESDVIVLSGAKLLVGMGFNF